MRSWMKAALGAVAGAVCAQGAAAQVGCATCSTKPLAGATPNTIPKCNKHDGLTQYPLSEKRYIKQFCHPTICPNSCFGHFKTQWTPWPQACPGWPQEGVSPANYGPNFIPFAPPADPAATPDKADKPATPEKPAPAAEKPADPPAPPTRPMDLPAGKPTIPTIPLPAPTPVPSAPPGGKLPDLPPAGAPGKF